jgi:hypothetical protein
VTAQQQQQQQFTSRRVYNAASHNCKGLFARTVHGKTKLPALHPNQQSASSPSQLIFIRRHHQQNYGLATCCRRFAQLMLLLLCTLP